MPRSNHRCVSWLVIGSLVLIAPVACRGVSRRAPSMSELRGAAAAGPRGLEVAWERDFFEKVDVRQLLTDGELLYAVTSDDGIHAIGFDGVHRWISHDLKGPVTSPPVSNSWGVAFLVGSDLYVFDRAYGNLVLKKRLPFPPSCVPAASETTLFVGSMEDNGLHTVDLDDGRLGWFVGTREGVAATPLVLGEAPRQMVYFAGLDGSLTALDAVDAEKIPPSSPAWRMRANDPNRAGLVAMGETILVASEDSMLYAVDRVTGGIRWSAPLGVPLERPPLVAGDRVYQIAGGTLFAIEADRGHVLWSRGKGLGDDAFVAAPEGRLFLFEPGVGLQRLDPATGGVLETLEVRAAEQPAPVAGPSLLVALNGAGRLIAYRL